MDLNKPKVLLYEYLNYLKDIYLIDFVAEVKSTLLGSF